MNWIEKQSWKWGRHRGKYVLCCFEYSLKSVCIITSAESLAVFLFGRKWRGLFSCGELVKIGEWLLSCIKSLLEGLLSLAKAIVRTNTHVALRLVIWTPHSQTTSYHILPSRQTNWVKKLIRLHNSKGFVLFGLNI